MKKKLLFFSVLAFFSFVWLFQYCKPAKNLTDAKNETIQYPNEDSELAILMRWMDKSSAQIRQSVLDGKSFEDVRPKFAEMLTARHTDEESNNENYRAMAQAFLKITEGLYSGQEKKAAFNLMVNSCLTCHKMYCPGPAVRIQKLLIQP